MHAADLARDWIEAWNARDTERVLSHFSEGARFLSPRAQEVTGNPVVEGHDALRAYWTAALPRLGDTRFELEQAVWDAEASTLVIIYERVSGPGTRSRACEVLHLEAGGRATSGEAMYGATLTAD